MEQQKSWPVQRSLLWSWFSGKRTADWQTDHNGPEQAEP